MKTMKRMLAIGGLMALLTVGCGAKEASEMTKFADEMCACKDVKCADAVFPKAEAFSKANEGKEVSAEAAAKYNTELARFEQCYTKLQTAGQ